MPWAHWRGTVLCMLPPTLFSLPAETEVIAAGEVLRRRNEVLTSVMHLESGRVLRGVLDDGYLRHQSIETVQSGFSSWSDSLGNKRRRAGGAKETRPLLHRGAGWGPPAMLRKFHALVQHLFTSLSGALSAHPCTLLAQFSCVLAQTWGARGGRHGAVLMWLNAAGAAARHSGLHAAIYPFFSAR